MCPVCRGPDAAHPLRLARVAQERDGHIVEAMLHCSNFHCQREYPVIDGVPILVREIRKVMAEQQLAMLGRRDLGEDTLGLFGDALGPGSPFDALRSHQSAYGQSHYSDLDPAGGAPSALLPLIEAGLALARPSQGPWLEIGCAVGRGSFALAERNAGLVLGVDLHFGLLQIAARALREGRVRYPRRRIGVVYEPVDLPVCFAAAERVDFWMADALALPFLDAGFGHVQAMNVLDCVYNPGLMLAEVGRALAEGGTCALCTPFDWSPATTPMEAWLGGHSQRGPTRGAPEPALAHLLAHVEPRLSPLGERELDWELPLHARAAVRYRVHLLALARAAAG